MDRLTTAAEEVAQAKARRADATAAELAGRWGVHPHGPAGQRRPGGYSADAGGTIGQIADTTAESVRLT
jgi:hypothetical protein